MRRRIFFTGPFFLFLLLAAPLAQAQTWEIGGFLGAAGYMGDLNPTRPYKFNRPAFGGQFKRNFNGYFSAKLSVIHGEIAAADEDSPSAQHRSRNLSFFSPVTELGLQAEYNFFDYIPSISKKVYTPYLFGGISAVDFNPKARYNGETYPLVLYGTEGQSANDRYRTNAWAIPVGAGMKYNFAGKWSLIAEVGYRTAFTDYLDDVSGFYPDPEVLINETALALSDRSAERLGTSIGTPGTQRGDLRRRDSYMFTGISLTFTFLTQKCPVVER